MLNDKHILITGASSGIGFETAIQCANQGAFVYLAGRNQDRLAELQKLIKNALLLPYDVCDEQQVKQAFAQIKQTGKPFHGLVNCAGVMLDAGFAMTRISDLQQQLNVNTVSAYLHSQLASRLMTRGREGSIVNLCSIVGEQGSAGQTAYATSKSALSGLTRSLSKELGKLNVRVNGVAPGFIDTPMTNGYEDAAKQNIIDKTALGRMGTPSDVAQLICFLLSEQSNFITGQIIGVDGGLSL